MVTTAGQVALPGSSYARDEEDDDDDAPQRNILGKSFRFRSRSGNNMISLLGASDDTPPPSFKELKEV
jgi:hypothetical protein